MYFLVAFSAVGIVIASQQYFILQSEETTMLARQTLDESFIAAMQKIGGDSIPELAKELDHQKNNLKKIHSSAATTIAHLKVRALVEIFAWCVVFSISGWTLIINHHKQSSPDTPRERENGMSRPSGQ